MGGEEPGGAVENPAASRRQPKGTSLKAVGFLAPTAGGQEPLSATLDLASASTPKEGREGGSGVTAPRLQQRMLAVAPMVDGGGFELVGWGLGEG